MQKPTKRPLWLGITTALLGLIGFAGVPEDVGTWRQWIEGALQVINYDIIRCLFVVFAIATLLLIFYPPNVRTQIWNSFKLGQAVAIPYLTPPLTQHGWTVRTGEEPECVARSIPGGGFATDCRSEGGSAVVEYYFTDIDPSARYVSVRADKFGIDQFSHGFSQYSNGFSLTVFCKAIRKSDEQMIEISIAPVLNLSTARAGDKHEWYLAVQPFTDHHKYENVLIDLDVIKRLEYTPRDYKWRGVSGIQLRIANASIVHLACHQKSTWRLKFVKFFKRETWIPWH